MQTLYDCEFFSNEKNLNKTCIKNKRRCELFYENYCTEFIEKGCSGCPTKQENKQKHKPEKAE